jgi:hydrogenase expression/formation protein HypE
MAHGGGGRLMHQLIENFFTGPFHNEILANRHDGAVLTLPVGKLAFTTDSYVVSPLFFPGGDIGSLSVYGTANDLAMCGARPLYISAGFIIEEGFPMETLWRVAQSMKTSAEKAGVQIVTGDTKVVDKGKGDGIFINTAGIGIIEHEPVIAPKSIKADDVIILSGDIGRHGITIMASREGLEFETSIMSDCAPLWNFVDALLKAGIEVHCLRDLTRGGLASALIELAEQAGLQFELMENSISVNHEVQAACEILGFDPIYVANEGRFVAIVPDRDKDRALEILRIIQPEIKPAIIGKVSKGSAGMVTMTSKIGAARVIDMLSGEQLPRIC